MCLNCYQDYGSPRITTDATRHAARLIGEANPWGPLHIVVEDDNFDDEDLESCRTNVSTEGSDADKACFAALVEMTVAERVSAGAIAAGFIPAWPSEAWPRSSG